MRDGYDAIGLMGPPGAGKSFRGRHLAARFDVELEAADVRAATQAVRTFLAPAARPT